MVNLEQIGKTAHAVHLAFCKQVDEDTQPEWDLLDPAHKHVIMSSVDRIKSGEINSPEESHNNFVKYKEANGWKYGVAYSREDKRSPRMIGYSHLSSYDRIKEELFFATVKSFMS